MSDQQFTIDQFNDSLRQSQFYKDWMRAHGINLTGPIKLSDPQRKAFQRDLAAIGVGFDGGLEIDPAGNMNQNEGFGKQLKRWGPIVGGAALAAFGIPGVMPGLIGGGATAGGGAAATAASGAASAAPAAAGGGFSFGAHLPTIIGAGGQLAGNLIGARAAGRAADAQERAANEALAFERQRYGEEEARLQPYRQLGSQAYQQVGRMLGIEAPPNAQMAGPVAATNPVDRMAGGFSFGRPQMGQRKTFANGRIGEWDGRGWKAVG